MQPATLCFVGAGNMSSSIIGGLTKLGYPLRNIVACDPHSQARQAMEQAFGITTCSDNTAVIPKTDVVVLAVKPQLIKTVCLPLAPHLKPGALVISIAAGISIANLQQWLPQEQAIVRCMPNTPALVQTGVTGLFANTKTSEVQRRITEDIMNAVGSVIWLESEDLMDAVTATSGSGPAYYFLFMEAMIQAGINQGLSAATAKTLTLQTALGAARLALESDKDIAELRRNVCSPGGTTELAITSLENNNLRMIVDEAVEACAARAKQISEELGQ